MPYPLKPTGDDIIPVDKVFAGNNASKTVMTTSEMLDGYNNDGETETDLTSRPDANRFNMFWYQIHNTLIWIINYIEELYNAKLEKSGGELSGTLDMNANKITDLGNPINDTDATNKQYVDNAINGNTMWISEIKMLAYPSIPTLPENVEIVPCDGRALSRATYAELFSMIGTAFGSGNGSTTFNIPDYRGLFLRGWNGTSGRDNGRVYGSIQSSGIPNITGAFTADNTMVGNSIEGGSIIPQGVFYKQRDISYDAHTSGGGNGGILGFNANRISNIYQDGLSEVRPINSNVYYVMRIK